MYVGTRIGMTWQHQTISLPANAFQVTTLPPIFFTTSDGFLPVIIPTSESQTVNTYVTHDGGASWSATNPVPTSAEAGTITVVDTTHSWIVGNTFDVSSNQYIHSTVYSTNTGGEHWMHHDVKFGTAILMIDFVSPLQGWAIDALHALYQTTDGGQTWTKV